MKLQYMEPLDTSRKQHRVGTPYWYESIGGGSRGHMRTSSFHPHRMYCVLGHDAGRPERIAWLYIAAGPDAETQYQAWKDLFNLGNNEYGN
jgi:hypothetical protein